MQIEVISDSYLLSFKERVQNLLDKGYKISSSYCGVINYVDGSSDPTYKAILLKDEKDFGGSK